MNPEKNSPPYRIGTGFDIHPLEAGRACILGGVKIPFEKGPLGHSDGDVLLHAISDALLGAAGLDDLGTLFPDSEGTYKNASSATLLQEVMRRIKEVGFSIANVDAVLLAESPKIGPHRGKIRESIARLLEIPPDRVNLKGKSAEKFGPIGSGEAIAAMATALLYVPGPKMDFSSW